MISAEPDYSCRQHVPSEVRSRASHTWPGFARPAIVEQRGTSLPVLPGGMAI